MRFLEVCETDISSDIIIENNIVETENYLRSVAEEYNIDYKTNDIRPLEYLYEDSIFSKIKNFIKMIFQKAIQFLIKIWKWIVNIVKTIWNKIKNFINKLRGKKEPSKKKVETKFISLEAARFTEKSCSTQSEIAANYKLVIEKISSRINRISKENISYMKKFESLTEKQVITENFDLVEEKIVYNDTPVRLSNYGEDIDNEFINKLNKNYLTSARIFSDDKDFIFGYNDYDMSKDMAVPDTDGSLIKVDPVIQGKYKIDHLALHYPEIVSTEKMNLIKESNDIIKAYNDYVSGEIFRIYNDVSSVDHMAMYKDGKMNILYMSIKYNYDMLIQAGASTEDCIKYIKGSYFPKFDGSREERENKIKQWIQLKINFNKNLTKILQSALITNHKLFNLSLQEAAEISLTQIEKGDYSSINKIIKEKRYEYIKFHPGGVVIDLRKIGLGCCLFSSEIWYSDKTVKNNFIDDEYNLTKYAFNLLSKYDVTVMTHGLPSDDKNHWHCQSVVTPSGAGPYEWVEDLLDRLVIDEGFKKINVLICNVNKIKLPDYLKRRYKNALIRMSNDVTLI